MKKIILVIIIGCAVYFVGRFGYQLGELPQGQHSLDFAVISRQMTGDEVIDLEEQQLINQEVAGHVLPGSNFYGLKRLGERAHVYLAKSETERQLLKAAYLDRRLAEAEVLFETGKSGQAQQMINQFALEAGLLMAEARQQDLLVSNSNKANDVRQVLMKQIGLQRSLMVGISKASPFYVVKAKLLGLELGLADTVAEKKAVQEAQLRSKHLKVISAIKIIDPDQQNDWDLAKNQLIETGAASQLVVEAKLGWLTRLTQKYYHQARQALKI